MTTLEAPGTSVRRLTLNKVAIRDLQQPLATGIKQDDRCSVAPESTATCGDQTCCSF